MNLPVSLKRVLRDTPELRHAYLVGGCVRDSLLSLPIKDYDVEVFGVTIEQLAAALARWGKVDLVGRSFGVVKLTLGGGNVIDFSIPRRDSKVAAGHKGFAISFDPEITLQEAAARRDYTINSLLYDPRLGQVLDFFGGQDDLKQKVLRHTSPAFVEDPLRVLRGMQFAARFELSTAPETLELCRRMYPSYGELAVERIREEWFKWATRSRMPSAGLRFLAATGWLAHYPELQVLRDTPQDPEWHPEGDVFEHTCHCCDALVQLPEWQAADEETRLVLSLAVLSHDLGKSATTERVLRDGRWRVVSPGHDGVGESLVEAFLARINAPRAIVERVVPLVVNHMAHLQNITDRAVRRLSKRLEPETIDNLTIVMTADSFGRPPLPNGVPHMVDTLRAKAVELQVQQCAPKPILMGRHLQELGLTPGPVYGRLLHQAYDLQLEGRIMDLYQALEWLGTQQETALPTEAMVKIGAHLRAEAHASPVPR